MAARVGKRKRKVADATEGGDDSIFEQASRRLIKRYSDASVVDMEDEAAIVFSDVKEYVPVQCYGIEYAMHLPGIPVGRVSTIRGDFMSAKSTIAQHIMAATQQLGGFVVLLDTEYAFARDRAKAIGVSLNKSKFMMPQDESIETVEACVATIEEFIDIARQEQDAGNNRLVTIVWDSVGATETKMELEADFGESRPGIHARIMSAALRRITKKIAEYRIILLLINQEKDRVDFFAQGKDLKTMMAEKPIMFHSTVVLRPAYAGTITNTKKQPTGVRIKVTVKKNKLAAPFSTCDFICNFDNGINNAASILSVALQLELVGKSGSWYTYKGRKFYEKDFAKILEENPEIMDALEDSKLKTKDIPTSKPVDEDTVLDEDEDEDED